MAYSFRNPNIDVIRTLASWLIVLGHSIMSLEFRSDFYFGKTWWITHILFTGSAAAVSLFFLISGYLLADKNRTPRENLYHTATRLLIPFVVFTVIIKLIDSWLGTPFSWAQFSWDLWKGGGTHLYFLTGLIILYLITPVLQILKKNLSERLIKISVFFLLFNSSLLLVSAYVLHSLELLNSIFVYWFMALGYFYYGMNYKQIRQQFTRKKWFASPGLLLLILTASILINAWWMKFGVNISANFRILAGYWRNHFSILVMLSGLLTFNWLMSLNLKKIFSLKLKKWFEFLAKYSYGVYLCHMSVLVFLHLKTPITINNPGLPLPAFMVSSFSVTLAVSYLISLILGNIKYLKIIVGEKSVT